MYERKRRRTEKREYRLFLVNLCKGGQRCKVKASMGREDKGEIRIL